ncbi:NAD(P)-binding protein [Mollisia scopiformis]|uniref:NAD(P)-binding protein n=1 Tax=Mollisia scopiformis TaxID=149040 RepID=A0A132BBD1_MOLSC|nr:NAD(P)-binding protein [Mollisia scopiformis]KUJ09730.1 NAD(P)-binding protein [Mollisia scopiformis]
MAEVGGRNVLVIIGAGGMGLFIARRLGSGRTVFLADYSQAMLEKAEQTLRSEGHTVSTISMDVSSYDAVQKTAQASAALGAIDAIVHTAGVAPGASNSRQIYTIDLLGTANVIDAFLPVISSGTSLVCIASMAGSMIPISLELEKHLATAPRNQLLQHKDIVLSEEIEAAGVAYAVAKRGNQLRVQAAAVPYGKKGARVNSVSPGVISTALAQAQLDTPAGENMRAMIAMSAVKRIGTPDDIANAVAFLASRESSLISGIDLLVDGGAVAGRKWPEA